MIVALLSLLLAGPVKLPGTLDLANTKDPISGKPVSKSFFVDWHGVRVHFELGKNAGLFRKEPTKHLKALGLKLDGKVLSVENTKCPVSGKPVKREHFRDYNGVRVYTCCPKCRPWETAAKTFGAKWIPGPIDLRNKKCPVMDKECFEEAPIWVDLDGIRVRVCCTKCIRRAERNPAMTFRLLGVDPKKLKEKHAAPKPKKPAAK